MEFVILRDILRLRIIIFTFFLLSLSVNASATPELGAKESRSCDFCHVEGNYSQLNDRGKFYLEHNYSFEGYVEKVETGGAAGLYERYCRGCHGKVPAEFRYKEVNEVVIDAIKSGRMPPGGFGEELSQEDIKQLASYVGNWCNLCHKRIETNFSQRELVKAPPNHKFELKHGKFWCFACHNPDDRDTFLLINGSELSFNSIPELCSQCHGTVYRDWKEHIHGRWIGGISDAMPDVLCTDCHNPHDVNPPFKPIKPEKPPEMPPSSRMPSGYPVYAIAAITISLILMLYSARR